MAQSSQQFYNLSTQNLLRINYAYCICTYCMCGFAPGLQKKKKTRRVCVCVHLCIWKTIYPKTTYTTFKVNQPMTLVLLPPYCLSYQSDNTNLETQ